MIASRTLDDCKRLQIGCELCVLEAEGPVPARAAAALRLLILTGCRLNEILTLRWDDVDRKAEGLHRTGICCREAPKSVGSK